MELLREIFTLYGERADLFGELLLAHMGLALAAIAMSGTIGLLAGIWIAQHPRFAPPVMGCAMCSTPSPPSPCWGS